MDEAQHGHDVRQPTPLMDRWREECLRALAQADPTGRDDQQVAYVVGAYFQAVCDGLAMEPDPQRRDRYSMQEAERFLAILRRVPAYRRQRQEERAAASRWDDPSCLRPDR